MYYYDRLHSVGQPSIRSSDSFEKQAPSVSARQRGCRAPSPRPRSTACDVSLASPLRTSVGRKLRAAVSTGTGRPAGKTTFCSRQLMIRPCNFDFEFKRVGPRRTGAADALFDRAECREARRRASGERRGGFRHCDGAFEPELRFAAPAQAKSLDLRTADRMVDAGSHGARSD